MQPTDKTWSWSANVIAFLPSKMRVLLLPFLHQTPSLYQKFWVQQLWKNAIFQHSTKPRLCALENIIMNHDEEGQDDNDLEKNCAHSLVIMGVKSTPALQAAFTRWAASQSIIHGQLWKRDKLTKSLHLNEHKTTIVSSTRYFFTAFFLSCLK